MIVRDYHARHQGVAGDSHFAALFCKSLAKERVPGVEFAEVVRGTRVPGNDIHYLAALFFSKMNVAVDPAVSRLLRPDHDYLKNTSALIVVTEPSGKALWEALADAYQGGNWAILPFGF